MATTNSKKHWWAMILRGIVAIIFAVIVLTWTDFTLDVLVIVLGAYIIIDGIFALLAANEAIKEHKGWWIFLFEGILAIILGLLVIFHPGVSLAILVILLGLWLILTGVLEILFTIASSVKEIDNWTLGIAGFVSLLLGVIILAYSAAVIATVVLLIAVYALIFGIAMIIHGIVIIEDATIKPEKKESA